MAKSLFLIAWLALSAGLASGQTSPSGSSGSLQSGTVAEELKPLAGEAEHDSEHPSSSWALRLARKLGIAPSPARKGHKAYKNDDYVASAEAFSKALADEPDSPELRYGLANSLYRQRRFDEAIREYDRALQGAKGDLEASTWYNLGNARYRKAERAEKEGRKESLAEYREALASYKKALELNSDDTRAKHNLEMAQARILELIKREEEQQKGGKDEKGEPPPPPSERAKAALARALQLAREHRYKEAKSVLEKILIEDATAAPFRVHKDRLDDILTILEGGAPREPHRRDPRARPEGLGTI